MKEETRQAIRDALAELEDATKGVPQLAVLALVMPHGTRGQMTVQLYQRGDPELIGHKLYEMIRSQEYLDFNLLQIVMTAAAKLLGEKPEMREAFDRVVQKWHDQYTTLQEVQTTLDRVAGAIDEYEKETRNPEHHAETDS